MKTAPKDSEQYSEPSAAAHMAAIAFWSKAPVSPITSQPVPAPTAARALPIAA